MNTVPIGTLRKLLDCDFSVGTLTWRLRDVALFRKTASSESHAKRVCASWNARLADKQAFTSIGNHGYFEGAIFNKGLLAHHVVWALYYGYWAKRIDHKDGNQLNNSITNLREVPQSINTKNARGKCTNTSGFTGVSQRLSGRWGVRIMVNYKEIRIGTFDTFDEACAARLQSQLKYGFTKRHGIFEEVKQ